MRRRINNQIRAKRVLVIGPTDEKLGEMPVTEALDLASAASLDLVEVAPQADPPVCKVADYGKMLYEESKKERHARHASAKNVVKETKFRLNIGEHDYKTKLDQARRHLSGGAKVKLVIMLRGRELAHPEFGLTLLTRVVDDLSDVAVIDQAPRHAPGARDVIAFVSPPKQK